MITVTNIPLETRIRVGEHFMTVVDYLNSTVICTLKPSPIQGIGVFTLRDVKAGDNLYCWPDDPVEFNLTPDELKELRPEILALVLDRYPMPDGGRSFRSPNSDQTLMAFVNHSSVPNSHHGIAIKDIKAGEEVTEDYARAEYSELQMKHFSFLRA